ncbi:MAG: diphosphate--fructose-6-phosphate 1-phosphotransferase [Spirochaetales bacterium]|jgi:ATP-dependent phosphofructokinase / diphosphate-dependent phosphofructokinase|nr:diphosphate--fructose-6-phosphate 1-phosphotransferase [Spirochaetales bacterium]
MKRNALVAQSGGPSPVINSSLQGVLEGCMDFPDHIDTVFAGRHGIEGVLLEELINLSSQDSGEIRRLRHTPAAGAIGTCRYKLKDETSEDYTRILDVFVAHNIGYFFYIGGNDSMDTAQKVSRLAADRGVDLVVTGVPKTIDNDIGDTEFKIIDHTPGYGSAARYWANLIQNVNEENRGMCVSEPVTVLQAMGRKSGWIPAAARLADPGREMPLQLYFAEAQHTLSDLYENVRRQLAGEGRCIVVVSEGFDVGGLGEAHDGFGHIEYGASRSTVAQEVVNFLNDKGLQVRGQATGQVPGVLQRSASILASRVDIEEAYQVGKKAVSVALEDGSGWMATILRKPGKEYLAYFDKVDLHRVANSVRQLPDHWISADGLDVTDAFIDYAMPIIAGGWPDIEIENGLQRFARLSEQCIEKKLSEYIPLQFR